MLPVSVFPHTILRAALLAGAPRGKVKPSFKRRAWVTVDQGQFVYQTATLCFV
jgi:hypothetical protein